MRKATQAEFHLGADYACVMLPHQNTETALARLYGTSEEVEYYGTLFTKAIPSHHALVAAIELALNQHAAGGITLAGADAMRTALRKAR